MNRAAKSAMNVQEEIKQAQLLHQQMVRELGMSGMLLTDKQRAEWMANNLKRFVKKSKKFIDKPEKLLLSEIELDWIEIALERLTLNLEKGGFYSMIINSVKRDNIQRFKLVELRPFTQKQIRLQGKLAAKGLKYMKTKRPKKFAYLLQGLKTKALHRELTRFRRFCKDVL